MPCFQVFLTSFTILLTPLCYGMTFPIFWSHVRTDVHYLNTFENDPTSNNSLMESESSTVHLTPSISLGADQKFREESLTHAHLRYAQQFTYAEDSVSNNFKDPTHIGNKIVWETLDAHLNSEWKVYKAFFLGFSLSKTWRRRTLRKVSLDFESYIHSQTRLSLKWNDHHTSHFALLLEQKINAYEEETYKVEPRPFSNPSFLISEIYKFQDTLELGAGYEKKQRIFEDFFFDQNSQKIIFALKWKFLEDWIFHTNLSFEQRNFVLPWKRHRPCGSRTYASVSSLDDAIDCRHREKIFHSTLGLQWSLPKNFYLATSMEWKSLESEEKEFNHAEKNYLLSFFWESEDSPLHDPLKDLRPWVDSKKQ